MFPCRRSLQVYDHLLNEWNTRKDIKGAYSAAQPGRVASMAVRLKPKGGSSMNIHSTTRLPGFTAEDALRQISNHYQCVAFANSLSVPGIVPAKLGEAECTFIGCRPCVDGVRTCCENRQIFREPCGPETPGKPPDKPTPASACRAVCCVDGIPQWS